MVYSIPLSQSVPCRYSLIKYITNNLVIVSIRHSPVLPPHIHISSHLYSDLYYLSYFSYKLCPFSWHWGPATTWLSRAPSFSLTLGHLIQFFSLHSYWDPCLVKKFSPSPFSNLPCHASIFSFSLASETKANFSLRKYLRPPVIYMRCYHSL